MSSGELPHRWTFGKKGGSRRSRNEGNQTPENGNGGDLPLVKGREGSRGSRLDVGAAEGVDD